MKQKRKVKSLIFQKKDFNEGLLSALLLILWVVLCLCSATLMTTTSVWAAWLWKPLKDITYSWMDDKVEVLYNLQFSMPNNLSGVVGEMYTVNNNDFYITSTPLTVNLSNTITKNVVDTWLYSNILWWAGNIVKSKNITIIWWSSNKIWSSNDNAVILWWVWDEIRSSTAGHVPSVIVWWNHNTIYDNGNWSAIIWWESNSIWASVSNSFILWWKSNNANANNVIIWWSGVTADTWNVFVFSNVWTFKPKTSKAFYLNAERWLWINRSSAGKWVTVNGPVRFGEIKITNPSAYPCNSSSTGNYWVIWFWNVDWRGCLVWCTASSAVDGKWDLLDRWKDCQKSCDNNSSYCSEKRLEPIVEPVHYLSYCTTWMWVDTGHASPCTPVWDKIENVVFETSLIDAADTVQCPANAANKCIYQCDTGYHLRGDETGKFPSYKNPVPKCFKDCDLKTILWAEWAATWNNWVITHNDTVIAYNKQVVPCSYHKYTPQLSTYPDYLDNGYGTKWDRNYIWMDNKRKYELPETCTNNAHQQTLVCVDWKMFIAKTTGNGKEPTSVLATSWWTLGDSYLWYAHSGYIYMTCATSGYKCDLGQYDLDENYIRGTLEDTWVITTPSNPHDRNTVNWTRWIYKLCKDYIVDNTGMGCVEDVFKNQQWDNRAYDKHYEFKGCMATYHPTTRTGDLAVDPRICRQECSVTKEGRKLTVYDQQSITLYKEKNKDCSINSWNDVCEHHTFKCVDGRWEDEELLSQYPKVSCYQKWEACVGFNVTPETYAAHNQISIYSWCHKWTAFPETFINWTYTTKWDGTNHWYIKSGYVDIQDPCIDWWHHYKLVWCVNCRHANHDQFCDESVENVEFDYYCSPISNWTVAGYKYWQWNLTKYNWTTWDFKYHGTCDFYCDDGYYKNGDSCTENPTITCPAKPTWEVVEEETRIYSNQVQYRYAVYETNTQGVLKLKSTTNWCFRECVSGYHRVNKACEKNYQYRSCIWTFPLNAQKVWSTSHYGLTPKEYEYNPDGWDCAFKCKTNYSWNGYACVYDDRGCGKCNHVVQFDGNWGEVSGPTTKEVVCDQKLIMPDATRSCHRLKWWSGQGSLKQKWDQVKIDSNLTFRAEWDYDATLCEYTCGGSAPTSSDVDISKKKAYKAGMQWNHVNETPRSTVLDACQWRCNTWLNWNGGLWCDLKKCAGWILPPSEWATVWPREYRWITDDDERKWTTFDWKDEWFRDPNVCEWRCSRNWESYTDSHWVQRCTKQVFATCSKTEKWGCEVDWNNDVDEDGYATSVDHKEVKDSAWNVIWWTWTCKWSPSWEDAEDCHICNGPDYKERIDADWNWHCVRCNSCAKNGFPYCFPIDFSSTCDEYDYLYNYYWD